MEPFSGESSSPGAPSLEHLSDTHGVAGRDLDKLDLNFMGI